MEYGQRGGTAAIVIGAGPAGLMAAEQLALAGIAVDVYDAMPSAGRKFLRAGIGGLNLTHAEAPADFLGRYSDPAVGAWLAALDAEGVRRWAAGLGCETFVGSSGRVFPLQKKAAPLLRAWLQRLRTAGVRIHTRHRWLGWDRGLHQFQTPDGLRRVGAPVSVFALGGGSWARLGSDGQWVRAFERQGIATAALQPANCGFEYPWSDYLRERYAGTPVKSMAWTLEQADGRLWTRKGEVLISQYGLEGSLVYAASAHLREQLQRSATARIVWDLLPDVGAQPLLRALRLPRGKTSLSNHLRKSLGLSGVKMALLRELSPPEALQDMEQLAQRIKRLPQSLAGMRPIDEAISTAGGVRLQQLDEGLMLKRRPGVFCAGEMLDWDAPTGGYLLTACLASGLVAGRGAAAYLRARA